MRLVVQEAPSFEVWMYQTRGARSATHLTRTEPIGLALVRSMTMDCGTRPDDATHAVDRLPSPRLAPVVPELAVMVAANRVFAAPQNPLPPAIVVDVVVVVGGSVVVVVVVVVAVDIPASVKLYVFDEAEREHESVRIPKNECAPLVSMPL